jgi:hypothetical protein
VNKKTKLFKTMVKSFSRTFQQNILLKQKVQKQIFKMDFTGLPFGVSEIEPKGACVDGYIVHIEVETCQVQENPGHVTDLTWLLACHRTNLLNSQKNTEYHALIL